MSPELSPVARFIQLRNPHPIGIRIHMLCHNIHSYLAQIEIGANSRCGRNSRSCQNFLYYFFRQLSGSEPISVQILSHIHKHLVDRIHMDILRSHIF